MKRKLDCLRISPQKTKHIASLFLWYGKSTKNSLTERVLSRLYLKADGHWISNTRSQPPLQAVITRVSRAPFSLLSLDHAQLSLPKTAVLECSTVRLGLLIARTLNRFAVPV